MSKNELNPVQKELSKSLLIAFGLISLCPISFGICWAMNQFLLRPELQNMPDKNGNIISTPVVVAIIIIIILGGVYIYNWAKEKLG